MRMFMNTSVKYCKIFGAKESTSKQASATRTTHTPNFYGILCALQLNNVNSYFIRILSLSSFPFFDAFHLGLFCRRCLLNCYTIIHRCVAKGNHVKWIKMQAMETKTTKTYSKSIFQFAR